MYRDPEGIHSLEQSDYSGNIHNNNNGIDDSYYKRRIESLNEEIKALNEKNVTLNKKIIMVQLCHNCYIIVCNKIFSLD